ncbi:hypothetical protein ACE4RR_00125 [Alteribacillus sp. HJP-4]
MHTEAAHYSSSFEKLEAVIGLFTLSVQLKKGWDVGWECGQKSESIENDPGHILPRIVIF